jgi:L-ascorbate metabolism protein UlaG (beta-lactamase superfamily)
MWATYFQPRNVPEAQMFRSQPGDWFKLDGIIVRNVNSVHGSGTADKLNGGPAMGFIIQFENGLSVYFAGSTALTMDMQLWGMLYKPDVVILPLNANRDPADMVQMVKLLRTENPNLKTVIPHHHRLQPPLGAPTPATMEAAFKASGLPVTVLSPDLKKVYELTK